MEQLNNELCSISLCIHIACVVHKLTLLTVSSVQWRMSSTPVPQNGLKVGPTLLNNIPHTMHWSGIFFSDSLYTRAGK